MMLPVSTSNDGNNGSPPSRDYFFLSESAACALPNYQYAGDDRSLLYKYVLSPVSAFLVNRYTPRTIAPNTITLVGLCFMVASYLIEWYYSPLLEPDPNVPAWIFLFNCMAMLIYQMLDNMDGKQARRTGSSSPLGLLFDHGCDAVNSQFGSTGWIIAIGLVVEDVPWMCWILVLGPMALFYVSTWEEYCTGNLILPIINGPNEGLVLGALTSLITFLFGVQFWRQTTWYDTVVQPYILRILPATIRSLIPKNFYLRNCDIQVFMACFGFVQETVSKAFLVARSRGISSLLSLLPFITLTACIFVIGWYDPDIWICMPRLTFHLISGLFVEMSTQLMLDHISKQRYQPLRLALIPLVSLTFGVCMDTVHASAQVDDFLLVYTSSLWTFLVFKVSLAIHEICCVLNIWCFDIVTPRNQCPMYASERKVKE